MALLWLEGFETFGDTIGQGIATPLTRKWTGTGTFTGGDDPNDNDEILAGGRTGGFALNMRRNFVHFARPPLLGPKTTVIVGFGLNFQTLANNQLFLNQIDFVGGSGQVSCLILNTGAIRVIRGVNTTLGVTAAGVITPDKWFYFELKVFYDNVAGTVEVRVDGVTELLLGPIDTIETNPPDQLMSLRGLANSSNELYDDIYILDDAGPAPLNDFLGPQRIVGMTPESAGDSTQWVPTGSPLAGNFDAVNDIPQDDDATFVESGVSGFKDLYNYQDPAIVSGAAIRGIQVNTIAKAAGASVQMRNVVKSGATEQNQSLQSLSGIQYTHLFDILPTDPDTAAAWTEGGLDALQAGFKVE